MRIIAGKHRGRTISAPVLAGLRPISARIKKSLFDILKEVVPGASFLDLFAGSGAVGLEALSRGAAFAFFLERDAACRAAIEANLAAAGLPGRGKVWPGDALDDLSWISFRAGVPSFDIIFLGPPYKNEEKKPLSYSGRALARIAASGLLLPTSLVVSQHHIKEIIEGPIGLRLFRREKYGDTILDFWRPSAS
ncbi:MAG: 16S rRNA (guanine(966)-N(2))-methyltransferase RsmD [Elusimicrobiota bacterium]